MPHCNLLYRTTAWIMPLETTGILFADFMCQPNYIPEGVAQFLPEKNTLSILPTATVSFDAFRQLIYAVIASERIALSGIAPEEKFAKIYYCALARYAAEHGIPRMIELAR